MNDTLSVARPTATMADWLLHIVHVLDHSPHLYSGWKFWTVAVFVQQRTRGWKTQLTETKRGNRSEPEEHIENWTFHRTRPAPGFRAKLPMVRHRCLIKARLKQFAGVWKV